MSRISFEDQMNKFMEVVNLEYNISVVISFKKYDKLSRRCYFDLDRGGRESEFFILVDTPRDDIKRIKFDFVSVYENIIDTVDEIILNDYKN